MTLDQLAIKYGSDKSSQGHNYCPFYEQHLPKNPKRILEIGVKEGASLKMWAEYFPNAEIHGLDLFSEKPIIELERELLADKGNDHWQTIHLTEGNQCDWRVLEELRKYDFDVIIDDGSHNARDQMITFFGLFNGKHYFIEDLHCCDEPKFYGQGLPEDFNAKGIFGMIYTHLGKEDEDISIEFDRYAKITCIYAIK